MWRFPQWKNRNDLTFYRILIEFPVILTKPMENPERKKRDTPVFDFIVLVGMMANLILAVFLVLYYFDFF